MDFYIVLGVNRGASLLEVKKAYRRLARRLHPDVNPGDERAALRFREIAEAYSTLSDPNRRQRYDLVGYEAPIAQGQAPGFEGFDFSAAVFANQQSTFGDLFADVLRNERVRSGPQERGHDLHQVVVADVRAGGRRREFHPPMVRQTTCRECAGTGSLSVPP